MKRMIVTVLIVLLLPVAALALEVVEGTITSGVLDRQPVDQLTSVPAAIGTIYCYTRLSGATEETTITHVWLKDDQEMARVELPVRSSNWRTWSSKKLLPEWRGNWQVVIFDAASAELATIAFVVE